MIVSKFNEWKPVDPIVLMGVAEGAEVLFQFLVHTFCLTISLWMICGADVLFDAEEPAELSSEL